MVFLVHDHGIAPSDQGADDPQIGLHAGRKDQGGLLPDPLGQLALELLVHLKRAIEKPRAGAACAKSLDGFDGGPPDLGMGGQSKVVVRTAHNKPVTLVGRLGAFALGQRDEIGIVAARLRFPGDRILIAFLEQVHVLTLLRQCDEGVQTQLCGRMPERGRP